MRWWLKLIAALIVIFLLLGLGWGMIRGVTALLNGADLNLAEPDPMFAQEEAQPTRPPQLDEEGTVPDHPTLDDLPMQEGAPVDKTADELIREAQQKANS